MKVLDPGKGKLVNAGRMVGDTYVKDVDHDIHFMRIENGYGIQSALFPEIQKKCKFILVREKQGWHYRTTVDIWMRHGHDYSYHHGLQKFLNIKYCDIVHAPPDFASLAREQKKDEQDVLF